MTEAASLARMRVAASGSETRGIRDVVLVLLALGPEMARGVLAQFDPSEVAAVSAAAGGFTKADAKTLDTVAAGLSRAFEADPPFLGSAAEVQSILAAAAPRALEKPPETELKEGLWQKVKALGDTQLRAYIEAQHPQAQAYILANLERDRAASLLAEFLAPQRNDVMTRMLALQALPDGMRAIVEEVLSSDLSGASASDSDQHRGFADLLNRLDQQQSRDVISHLQEVRPDDVGMVKRYLFQFEDLALLPTKALSLVADRVATESLIVALQGADPAIQAALLAALAPRARRMVEAELQSAANANPRDVAEARRQVSSAVLALVATGAVALPEPPAAA